MKLYSFEYPENKNRKALYFRNQNGTTSYDTYFNSFPASQYAKWTGIKEIYFEAECLADSTAELCSALIENKKYKTQILEKKEIKKGEHFILKADISSLKKNTVIFPRFKITDSSESFCIKNASWNCNDNTKTHNVKIASVICTYNREEFVKKNLNLLKDSECVKDGSLKVFIIDNGNSLKINKDDFSFAEVIPNKNLGGSGGFTRGIMEVLKFNAQVEEKEKFSHILLMDDDIEFSKEVIYKTKTFLSILKPEYFSCITGGAMFNLDAPCLQHENGAKYTSLFISSVKHNLDFSKKESLIKNMDKKKFDYQGWWYCAIPIENIKTAGLPLPLFIKADDIEYSLRIKKMFGKDSIITLNGIGVHHKPFTAKLSPYLVYYSVRNRLIVNALRKRTTFITGIMLIFARYITMLLKNRHMTFFLEKAFLDFLKGPDFLLTCDGEILNRELISLQKNAESQRKKSLLFCFLKSIPVVIKLSFMMLFKYGKSVRSYRKSFNLIVSEKEWKKRLNLEK
ncbi:MAG: glycosyltransferase family 2 protein [Treponema sp.]|nr:glycosyltransferase family 2 protein [Treponema sp.]